ncbi:hypothetical protein BKA70DRAFT_1491410 [Coprinopsis sp. MPI-PUGE-AT-0042]|nr:hypothetical protein BKA70DRAFT_1491410 [Coprinopsis sp. MPI-PUGE-AT-0042]
MGEELRFDPDVRPCFDPYTSHIQDIVAHVAGLFYSILLGQLYGRLREVAISFACTSLISLVGDAFLVWRATVIWNHHRMLRWVPTLVYAASFGICVVSLMKKFGAIRNTPEGGMDRWENLIQAQRTYHQWRITDFLTSVMVSLITTLMIYARLVFMERKMKHLSEQTGGTFRSALPYRQLLTLLLESALPFTLVGVVSAICTGVIDSMNPTHRHAVRVLPMLMVLWINFLALGPQLIVFRIISGTTWTSAPTTHYTRPISQPILFVDDPVVSALTAYADEDDELESQEVPKPTEVR